MQLFGNFNPATGGSPRLFGGPVLRARPITSTMPPSGAGRFGTFNPRPIIGSYKKGTKRVKKTGAYILHKDEAVLDKKKADTMRAKVKATMGKKAGC